METLHGGSKGSVWRTQKQSGNGEMSVIGIMPSAPGHFILTDFVSATFQATLNFYADSRGCDKRYPQNELPYVDTIKYLVVPEQGAALAAMPRC